jgi:5-methylcytosine-specific restriction protein B
MNKYKEFELAIFNWLKSKNYADQDFTFSVRQKANKGAELNYFIGTENSKYFSTTFWNIPVAYPGSSSDLINLVFGFDKSNNYVYDIQFNQTKNPESEQNELALQLIRNCKTTIKSTFDRFYENDASNKMEFFRINGKSSYTSIDELIIDANADIEKVIPIVSAEIDKLKQDHPSFKGHRFTIQEQKKMFEKMEIRFKNYQNSGTQIVLIDDTDDENDIEDYIKSDIPLNQILYGPPGTGKTYNSINKAISIINPDFDLTQDRRVVKKEYDRLVTENQILFTTFHQSMSYEDFIEGIKPHTKNENVIYAIEDGIFKTICDMSIFHKAFISMKKFIGKQLPMDSGNSIIENVSNDEIRILRLTDNKCFKFHYLDLMRAYEDCNEDIENIKKHKVSKAEFGSLLEFMLDINNRDKFVLIIDEINRGNVSQIFGELITLIEEDKRIGKEEALEVMLPYSKEKFGVPPNLYIIGTMNTADRSVEALDTALRRRFSFEEMPPKTKVVEEKGFNDYSRVAIMEKINNRIEVLLDRNHTLGHAYFIKKNFKSSFENEIISLLQEYFYNDYGKIGLVLGKGFVREKAITAKNDKSIFADFDTKNDVDINKSYELIPFPEVDFDAAIQTLLV